MPEAPTEPIADRTSSPTDLVDWRLRVAYLGSPFLGWQRQPQGLTVQEALEAALATTLRMSVACEAAGRTDTGVHASGQVVHFRAPATLEPCRVLKSLDSLLPAGAAVRDLERAPEGFSARHSARWREYCYRIRDRRDPLGIPNVWIPRRRFDPALLSEALSWFEGRHDFGLFCIPRDDGKHTLCTLMLARGVVVPGGVDLWIRGDRFLHRMVRAMVGFCLDVARGTLGREHFEKMIGGQRVDPRFWAPPDGLTLERVGYDDYTEPPRPGCPDGSYDRLVP